MRRISMIGTAAAALLFAANVSAQAPNLAGKWTRVDDPAAQAGGGGGRRGGGGGGGGGFNCGMECTIAQDAKTLTVTRTTQAGEQKLVFNLDGSESKNMMPGRQGGDPTAVVSKATVAGNKITIATTREFQGQSFTSTQTLSLEGGNLVVESSSGREGATPTKVTYKKG
jgi:hypothetical protein